MAGNRGFDRLTSLWYVLHQGLWMAGNRGFDRLVGSRGELQGTLWMAGNRGFDRLQGDVSLLAAGCFGWLGIAALIDLPEL